MGGLWNKNHFQCLTCLTHKPPPIKNETAQNVWKVNETTKNGKMHVLVFVHRLLNISGGHVLRSVAAYGIDSDIELGFPLCPRLRLT